jgi:uncharacterized membrane protein (UPF0182 family)
MANRRRPPSRLWLLGAAAVLLLGVPSFADVVLDWLWFGELGYRQVFIRALSASSILGASVFVIAFIVLFANLLLALSSIDTPYVVLGPMTGGVRPPVLQSKQLRSLAVAAAVVGGVLLALAASSQWLTWLKFVNAVPFGVADPLLGYDVGFYVFTLPVLSMIRGLLVALIGLSFAGAAAIYVLAGLVRFTTRAGIAVGGRARRHLAMLVAAFLVVLAFGAWLDVPNVLLSPAGTGVVYGASYSDVAARVPALRLLAVLALVGAALAVFHAFSSRLWPVFAAIGLYAIGVVGGAAYASVVQRLVVSPNEQAREAPYIQHNVAATRRAFAIDEVEEREVSGDATLSRQDIEQNAETLGNVRLWDHQPLLDTFGQLQEIRTYYDFFSVDNDRYEIDGRYRQIMLSARELNSASLPNATWINTHLAFTHGYGLTLGPVNQVTSEGLPVLFIRDIPPESTTNLMVTQPSIYFGERTDNYAIVNTRTPEFHYPQGDDNVVTTYEGSGGVPIGNFLQRLIFSLGLPSYQLLFNTDITPASRVLYHRDIRNRVEKIASFLQYDRDPYLVVSDGRLFWMMDAYTMSDHYPYASPIGGGINYIRNSVKIVIDAYNGTTTYYLADNEDPVALTLDRIFPGFFRKLDEMPPDLRRHIRYPEDIFAIQTAMYTTFHMTNPSVFYNKEDQWEVPAIDVDGNPVPMEPYYTIMKLPGADRAEFIQMLPLTPRRKDNLAAWMVARSDGEHYGRLMVFEFPKQKVVFGPRQIVARINQDQLISPQITLWNQQGSQVIQGTLLVIPIEESMIYIRPLYLRAAGGRIPELKRVIVAYQNQIVMDETLDRALDQIFGGTTPSQPASAETLVEAQATPQQPAPVSPLAQQALDHYQRAVRAQRDGNWSLYGEEIRRVGEILERMSKERE